MCMCNVHLPSACLKKNPVHGFINEQSGVSILGLEEEDKGDHWQDRISSGFDRIVAFASTELDKRRRSTEDGSANTSPDSGIGHGDPPPVTLPRHNPPDPKMPRLFKTPPAKASPGRDSPPVLDAPLIIDMAELPRTPSPSSPPDLTLDGRYSPVSAAADDLAVSPPPLPPSVPLRYQRPEIKTHHFKKKFVHRETWETFESKFQQKSKEWNEFPPRPRITLLPSQQH